MKPKVLAILYPGCIFFEISLALELLSSKFEIVTATPDGNDHIASNGIIIKNCIAYTDINLENCHAVLVPGGDPGSIKDNKPIEVVIQNAFNMGLWLAAICAGPSVLAKARILKSKKIAHGYNSQQLDFLKNYFEGVELTQDSFVADGKILTAKPDAHIDFAVELACRLECADASKANRIKDYYRGILGRKIRPLSLAVLQNHQNQFLFHKGYDRVKKETFYRPLGGGIDFSESGKTAIEREMKEELELEVTVSGMLASFENIFTFDGHPGHEIIMLFDTQFKDRSAYARTELNILESGKVVGQAVWRSIEQINNEGSKLYPSGIDKVLMTLTKDL